MSIALIIFVLMVFGPALLTTVIVLREKRFVWEYEPQESEDSEPSMKSSGAEANPYAAPGVVAKGLRPTPFASNHGRQLKQLGFEYVGDYRHAKRGIYKIRYDFWVSPESDVLAWTGSGSLSGIQVNNLEMITLGQRANANSGSSDPVVVVSITNDMTYAPNLSGWIDTMVFPDAKAAELLKLHRQRLQLIEPGTFSDDPMSDYLEFQKFEADEVCRLGFGKYIKDDKSVWLPKLFGALRAVALTYGFQIGRRLSNHRKKLKKMLARAGK